MAAPLKGWNLANAPSPHIKLPNFLTHVGPDPGELDSFTIDFWFFANSVPSFTMLLSCTQGSTNPDWDDEGISLYIRSEVGAGYAYNITGSGLVTQFRSGTVPSQIWTHVAFTYDATTRVMSTWENGTLIATETHPTGRPTFGFSPYWYGKAASVPAADAEIARVRFWNKALTEQEIIASRDAETPDPLWEGLVANYQLDSDYVNEPKAGGHYVANLPGNPNTWTPSPEGGGGTEQQFRIAGTVDIEGTPAEREVLVIKDDQTGGRQVLAESTSGGDGSFDISYPNWEGGVIALALDKYGNKWTPETALGIGAVVHPSAPNGFVYDVTSAGTTGATEPTWATDNTVQSGSVTLNPRPFFRPVASGPLYGEPVA